jgi:ComF family protein
MRAPIRFALDAILPPRCLACDVETSGTGALCADCWSAVDFLAAPHCECCGLPFEFEVAVGSLCGTCTRERPSYTRARAVFRYGEISRALILRFKHGDRTNAAPAFGNWLARAGRDLLTTADLVVPVPLHRFRLFARRFNQSALLAQAIARESGVAVAVDLLARMRNTPSQAKLSPARRSRNVNGAFNVRRQWRDRVAGLNILLVDDVLTTGATVEECTKTLLAEGARSVDVVTLARVVRNAN